MLKGIKIGSKNIALGELTFWVTATKERWMDGKSVTVVIGFAIDVKLASIVGLQMPRN